MKEFEDLSGYERRRLLIHRLEAYRKLVTLYGPRFGYASAAEEAKAIEETLTHLEFLNRRPLYEEDQEHREYQ